MALKKDIRQDDGVITSYHRILYTQATINSHVSIAVLSYIDDDSRQSEGAPYTVEGIEGLEPGDVIEMYQTPYKRAVTYETGYNENMTVEDAYAFLKTLPVFEGAEDI